MGPQKHGTLQRREGSPAMWGQMVSQNPCWWHDEVTKKGLRNKHQRKACSKVENIVHNGSG